MIHRHARPWFTRFIAWLCFVFVAALVIGAFARSVAAGPVAAVAPSSPTFSGPAAAHQGEPGAWTCEDRAWLVGDRFGNFSADNDALGGALPDGYLAVIANKNRHYQLVLYSIPYGDLVVDVPFETMGAEPGTTYPTGRFDPLGKPSLSYHGQIKIIQALWGGGGGAEDRGGRIYTWCGISP